MTGGVGGELGGIHRLNGRRTDAEVPGQVGAQPILEGVLTRRELLEWGTAPVNVAFLANAMFGGDLPADAKVTGPSNDPTITVDKDGLAAQVAKTLAALGPLAYSAEAVAHSNVKVQVTDLGVTGRVGGATVPVSGRYRFEVTLDPGDGAKSSSLTVPIRCTAVNSTNTQVVDSPTAKPAMAVAENPTYTG